ncbi:hypothetical protein DPMN_057788 [Dreissena polymorpha]|uniref:Uncharacterized protein n=1 Tax=Dreissena polymorpha TaxID=45954 RepID=A0A9D4HEP2_DREPO|nr:hypothetical protein DPMN_057788 [Dreissena polymorpha]
MVITDRSQQTSASIRLAARLHIMRHDPTACSQVPTLHGGVSPVGHRHYTPLTFLFLGRPPYSQKESSRRGRPMHLEEVY